MHFRISKSAQNYFSNIINMQGYHGTEDKNKFSQFDVYYTCALIGMAARQIDVDTSDLKDLVERYPKDYKEAKAHIAGLLISTEAKRMNLTVSSEKLEETMLKYLSDDQSLLSEEGVRLLDAYSLKGFKLLQEYPLIEKPTSREEYLQAFYIALNYYEKKD